MPSARNRRAVSIRRGAHRRRRAEPRAHRSLRAAAAARASAATAGPIYTNPACAELVPILLRDSASLAMRDAERANRDAGAREAASRRCSISTMSSATAPAAPDHCLRRAARTAARHHGARARGRPHHGFLEHRAVGRAKPACGASSCSRAISANTTRPSCRTLGASSPPTWCSWKAPTATAGIAGATDTERELGAVLAQAARDGGNVIVPAFAIGRSQELLYLLAKHYGEWHLARWKIFLDSPMAIEASRVYWHHPDRFDEDATRLRDELSRHAAAAEPGAVRNGGRITRHQQHARRRHHHRRAAAWRTAAACCTT